MQLKHTLEVIILVFLLIPHEVLRVHFPQYRPEFFDALCIFVVLLCVN